LLVERRRLLLRVSKRVDNVSRGRLAHLGEFFRLFGHEADAVAHVRGHRLDEIRGRPGLPQFLGELKVRVRVRLEALNELRLVVLRGLEGRLYRAGGSPAHVLESVWACTVVASRSPSIAAGCNRKRERGREVAEILRLTDGRGVDVAIEALGTQSTFESALRVLRPGGTLSSLGVYSSDLTIPLGPFGAGLSDLSIVTTLCPGGKERMRCLMSTITAGRVDLRPLVTHRFKLDQIEQAYELFGHQQDGVLKVAITP
jgi:hypothetical protein